VISAWLIEIRGGLGRWWCLCLGINLIAVLPIGVHPELHQLSGLADLEVDAVRVVVGCLKQLSSKSILIE
jgi:hypothetical protein